MPSLAELAQPPEERSVLLLLCSDDTSLCITKPIAGCLEYLNQPTCKMPEEEMGTDVSKSYEWVIQKEIFNSSNLNYIARDIP
jgi:hypothetical protein